MVRSFTLCVELNADDVIVDLFKLFFSIIRHGIRLVTARLTPRSKDHSHRVEQDMLEVLQSVATELDFMNDELLDAIFENLIEPAKVSHPSSRS